MIKEVKMYSVVCDRCGKPFIDEFNGIVAWVDEAPMAYKSTEEIVELIKPTVDVIDVIKPIYNFKAKL